ncbi:hypothetical protein OF83DRAFT_558283 [Amylostereum chailletii]|nr:hypothetical protein OF83DRAFT_558283 [Amylostereum chailletii]
MKALSEATQARFASHVRAMIMYEPPTSILGLPAPPATWPASVDLKAMSTFMSSVQLSWLTSYFTHGDLSTRDVAVLSYAGGATSRVPTVENMTVEDIASIVERDGGAVDVQAMRATKGPALGMYRKACFDRATREMVPRMKVCVLCGTNTVPECIAGFWDVMEDDEGRGGGFVEGIIVPGMNHFIHWDNAAVAVKLVREVIDGV